MPWHWTVRADTPADPDSEYPEPRPRRLLPVRVMSRTLGFGVLAAVVAAVVYQGQPPRDAEAAASCEGLAGYVQALAVHPDGATVSACSSDGSLTLWEAALGSSETVPAGDAGVRGRVAIAGDGSELVVAELDGSLTFRDGMTGRRCRRLEAAKVSNRQGLAYRRDADLVASADLEGVDVWRPSTGRRARPRLDLREAITLAIAPDGRALAIGERGGMVRIVEPAGRGTLRAFQAHQSAVWSLAFAGDGRMLATAGRQETTVRVWEPATGRLLAELDGHTLYQVAAFSPGGEVVATAGRDGVVRLWDPATGRRLQVIPVRRGHVTSLAFSPGARGVACGGNGWISWLRVADSPGT